jgi:hypothetical protein
LAGLFWWPIGVAAAIRVILYFTGAVISHIHARERFDAAMVVLLVAAAAFGSPRVDNLTFLLLQTRPWASLL